MNANYHLGNGMDIVNLTETEMEKDLGIWIDKDLKCTSVQKGSKQSNLSLRNDKVEFKHIDVERIKIMYNTNIRPHLAYCVQV